MVQSDYPPDDARSAWGDDDRFMLAAFALARQAELTGEVPVGAVAVADGKIVGSGYNRPISMADPTAHAEVLALREAANTLGNYRLPGVTLYVTLEPCVMCAGAIVLARIDTLVFAMRDIRFGAVRSKFQLADSALLNHRVTVREGLMAAESAELVGRFFRNRRR